MFTAHALSTQGSSGQGGAPLRRDPQNTAGQVHKRESRTSSAPSRDIARGIGVASRAPSRQMYRPHLARNSR
jgi:hypothetical protein